MYTDTKTKKMLKFLTYGNDFRLCIYQGMFTVRINTLKNKQTKRKAKQHVNIVEQASRLDKERSNTFNV